MTILRLNHIVTGLAICLIALLCFRGGGVDAQSGPPVAVPPEAAVQPPLPGVADGTTPPVAVKPEAGIAKKKRLREGTVLKGKLAQFRATGNRTTMFVENGTERFVCLENVNLDRILQVFRNNPVQQTWNVDVLITEFQGENYALVQRAALAKAAPPDAGKETVTK